MPKRNHPPGNDTFNKRPRNNPNEIQLPNNWQEYQAYIDSFQPQERFNKLQYKLIYLLQNESSIKEEQKIHMLTFVLDIVGYFHYLGRTYTPSSRHLATLIDRAGKLLFYCRQWVFQHRVGMSEFNDLLWKLQTLRLGFIHFPEKVSTNILLLYDMNN